MTTTAAPIRFFGYLPEGHYARRGPEVYVRDVMEAAYLTASDDPAVVRARLESMAAALSLALRGDLPAFQWFVADDPAADLPDQVRTWLRELAAGTASGVPVPDPQPSV